MHQFGLAAGQANVYLSALQLGPSSVQLIAKKAGVKRPTAYLILADLVERGLVALVPTKGKQNFVAENPERLLDILDRKKKSLNEALPQLLSLYHKPTGRPQVLLYEGKAGVMQVYQMIAMEAKEAWWLADLGYITTHWPEITKIFMNLISRKQFRQREINSLNPAGLKYVKKYHSDRFTVRYTTQPITIDFALFNDKVAIFSLKDNGYSVVIHDQAIVESFRSLYQLAWEAATPLSKVKV